MKGKIVLILGAKGTLGQVLYEEFSKNGYQVTAWDREDLDVTSPEAERKISDLTPDIIINAVAYNAVDLLETDPEARKLAFLINGEVPGKLARIAKNLGAIFVHYSSDYVFKGDKKAGYKEDDLPDPISAYGQSKYKGEKQVLNQGDKYYLIRLSRLFGKKGSSESSKRTFVDIMLSELDKRELEVGNTETSDLTYAPDLAKLTREIIEEKKPWGIYHGANERACTWYGWAKEIFKILGKGPKVIPTKHTLTPKETKHPENSTLLNTKLPKQRLWQEALAEFLNKESK